MTKPTLMSDDDVREEVSVGKRIKYLEKAKLLADKCRSVIKSEFEDGQLEPTLKRDLSLVTNADRAAERVFRDEVRESFPEHGVIGEEFLNDNPHPHAEFQWIIDPIDGTTEFVQDIPVYGTIIALHYKRKPLVGLLDHSALNVRCCGAFGLGVTLDDKKIVLSDHESQLDLSEAFFDGTERVAISAPANFTRYGENGEFFIRVANGCPNLRILHGCYAHTCTIRGAYDAMIEWNIREWDVAAAQVLVEEAGGKYECLRQTAQEDGSVYCAVFGKPRVVDSVSRLFREHYQCG